MKWYGMLMALSASLLWGQPVPSSDAFTGQTLRIDFYIAGNAQSQQIIFDQLKAEGAWPGSPRSLLDPSDRGAFRAELVDPATGTVLFASEFVSMFSEYAITPPALGGKVKAVHHTVRTPMPRSPVRWVLKGRDDQNQWAVLAQEDIDPASPDILRDPPPGDLQVIDQETHGDAAHCVDFVFLAEGYTQAEFSKFKTDLARFTAVLFGTEPFKSHRRRFNIRGVFCASEDSGMDDPAKGRFARTALDATYRTLGMDHYLGTASNRAIRDMAAAVPYDAILIMVNDEGYGGNGIYNWFTMFTAGRRSAEEVFLHELGHGFGGLADEYYGDASSTLTASEYYRPGVEPYEPNVTRLLDPANVKWKALLTPGVAVPTPWGQAELDSLDGILYAMGSLARAELDSLRKAGASQEVLDQARQTWTGRRREAFALAKARRQARMDELEGVVGVFEGAAHLSKGVYRPAMECLMNHMLKPEFCPVCQKAFLDRIDFYAPLE